MAEEWWSSARTGGDHASTSPATAESGTISRLTNSMLSSMQPGAPFFLDDPHVADWTQPFMQGKAAEAEEQPTGLTFNALLQLQGDASHQFLLDQAAAAPPVLPPYPVSDAGAASQQGAPSFYADSQQQFPSFFSSSVLFGAPARPSPPPPLLLQAQTPKPLKPSTTEPAVQDACSSSATKRSSAAHTTPAAAKKPRTETPSSMPTFKVRKEKLGDRITALQQLVSPFGKTDTASVLHEAIGYIKFLHDQVAVSTQIP
uniref:Uncharacterized protein n=1 Tax=Avena sativa TaxID=4498 RepID=A0ACD5TF71_AVESA